MVQPLNQRTIHAAVNGARRYVQEEKVQIARRVITREQYRGRWPDKYFSYRRRETRNNLYKDPEVFFRVQAAKPEWYADKWIFRPLDEGAAKFIRQAAIEAHRLIIEQLQKYISAPNVSGTPNISTGHYASMIRIRKNNADLATLAQLDNLTGEDVVYLSGLAEYATRAESNAFHFARVGGIFYFAAQFLRRKYPMLNFRFSFVRSGNAVLGAPRSPGSSHPVLAIGTTQTVTPKLQRPRKETYNHRTGRRRWYYENKP